MSPDELQDARHSCAALKQIFMQHEGGFADLQTMRRVSALCLVLTTLVNDAESQRQIRLVEEHARTYFSAEHESWNVGWMPGVQFLRMHILRALILFHSRLNRMEAVRRSEEILPGGLEATRAALDALERNPR